jgi:hypothetical protein
MKAGATPWPRNPPPSDCAAKAPIMFATGINASVIILLVRFLSPRRTRRVRRKGKPCFYNREKRERPRKSQIGLIFVLVFRVLSRLSRLIKIPSRPSRLNLMVRFFGQDGRIFQDGQD